MSRHDHVGTMVHGQQFAWCTAEGCGQRWELDDTRGWQPIPHWVPDPPALEHERSTRAQ